MSDFESKVKEIWSQINFETTRYEVNINTSMGDVRLELFPDRAPEHCKNIISLSKAGFYNGLLFHRIIKGFVIQGGCPHGSGMGGPGYNVKAEFNDYPHEPGVLSMARAQDPNSAGSQFFLVLERVPHLDNAYTVFGKAADDESLQVIKNIGSVRTGAGDRPVENVVMKSVTVAEYAVG